MNYIVTEIVDKFDGTSKRTAAWYEFIWNRTRAIRKDITVQRLTGLAVIEILEKTARFHILCSYRLCEEPANVFDFKMNEENLVNAVQLLREMYGELERTGAGHQATNRSEFLCYHILQNLDKDGLVREISQIDQRTLQSDHLRFAVRTFVAYQTRNYFAFMRLLLDASLLQACILNRYLPRVRLAAFRLIKRAFSSPKDQTAIPQDYFMKALLLKENQLRRFCKLIDCELADQKVIFTKNRELNSDARFQLERNALIDAKFERLKLSGIVDGSVQKQVVSVDELTSQFEKVDFFNNP